MKYEPAKDTAIKIRKALKTAYPKVKFSVTTKHGAVRVVYQDGPQQHTIQNIVGAYESSNMDSMQDMKVTTGYVDPETGERISGADFIFVNRELSPFVRSVLHGYGAVQYEDFCNVMDRLSWAKDCENQIREAFGLTVDQDIKALCDIATGDESQNPLKEKLALLFDLGNAVLKNQYGFKSTHGQLIDMYWNKEKKDEKVTEMNNIVEMKKGGFQETANIKEAVVTPVNTIEPQTKAFSENKSVQILQAAFAEIMELNGLGFISEKEMVMVKALTKKMKVYEDVI